MGRPYGSKNKLSKKLPRTCQNCGNVFFISPSRLKCKKGIYCSKKCFTLSQKGNHFSTKTEFKKGKHYSINTEFKKGITGNLCVNWKGGKRYINGYKTIYMPNHKYTNKKYVLEHRIITEQCIKRYLKPHEVVHHINGIKDDNRINNLYLFPSKSAHTNFHLSKKNNKLISNLI